MSPYVSNGKGRNVPSMDAIIGDRLKAIRSNPGLLYGSAERAQPAATAPPLLRGFEVLELREHPAAGPEQFAGLSGRFLAALDELVEDPQVQCWRCGTPCAEVEIRESEFRTVRRWVFAALVAQADGEAVSVQCEACAPDVALEPWPEGQPASVLQGDLTECRRMPDGARTVHVAPVGATGCRCGALSVTPPPAVAGHQE